MANPLHIKGSRTRVLNTFPTNDFGKDGDIVIARILNKGVFLCTKAGGMWYVANRMEELRKHDKVSMSKLQTNSLSINKLINAESKTDKILVSDFGIVKYRTSEQIANELNVAINDIQYKQAYCSLGQYTNKEDCEANNGTWYYSENDSHDSISSTAENELLTVASSLGKLDAEPTLLYDGSTLEIKHNSDFDDNWQTSAQTNLLKLSYGTVSANMSLIDAGTLTIDATRSIILDATADISLSATGGNITMDDGTTTVFDFDVNGVNLKIMDDADTGDYLNIGVEANGHTTFTTVDDDGTAANLTFVVDGDVDFEVAGDQVFFQNDSGSSKVGFDWSTDNSPFIQLSSALGAFEQTKLTIAIDGNGDTTFRTYDGNAGTASSNIYLNPESYIGIDGSDLMLDATQKLYFDANNPGGAIGNTYIQESGADVLDFYVGGVNILKLTEAGGGSSDKVSVLAETPIYFDGGTHTSIYEVSDDVLRISVGGDAIMQLSEKGDDGNEVSFGSSCVGFTQLEPTYDATNVVVDFRHSNKQNLTFGAGNITNIRLYFPLVSGNFQLLIKQDGTGSRTVTNWKVIEFDESAADGSEAVVWAGGSDPTLTTDANHVDILSFYWDADNEIAYGVATLDFQF